MVHIGIVGSRSITDYVWFEKTLNDAIETLDPLPLLNVTGIISGGAIGVDSLAERWAREHNIPIIVFKPDYKKYGNGSLACLTRNTEIVNQSDFVLAFWDGVSTGTQHSSYIADQQRKRLKTFVYKKNH